MKWVYDNKDIINLQLTSPSNFFETCLVNTMFFYNLRHSLKEKGQQKKEEMILRQGEEASLHISIGGEENIMQSLSVFYFLVIKKIAYRSSLDLLLTIFHLGGTKDLPGGRIAWCYCRVGGNYDILFDIPKSNQHRLNKFYEGCCSPHHLNIVAAHLFTDIPESTQHQAFLGILILVLLTGKMLFLSINLRKLSCTIVLNPTYKQGKVACLVANILKLKHTVCIMF